MTLAICRALTRFLHQNTPSFRVKGIPFQGPIHPFASPLNRWSWQRRGFEATHLLPEGSQKVTPKYNLPEDGIFVLKTPISPHCNGGDGEMASILHFLKDSDFKGIYIERCSLVNNQEWITDLLEHISQLKVRLIRVSGYTNPPNHSSTVIELIYPTELEVENNCYLFNRKTRPEAFEISLKGLSKRMISSLSHMICHSSDAHDFEITFK